VSVRQEDPGRRAADIVPAGMTTRRGLRYLSETGTCPPGAVLL